MIAMKNKYPEGTPWTNDNFYAWKGGYYSGGYGCAGFAFLLNDAAFGELPARFVYDITIDDVLVGDILRINNDSHSVIVLEVYGDYVVIAEGNYNSSIHWGRKLTASQVANAVAWAYNNEIVTGDLNTKQFNPNADVTREQLALMIYRYAKYKSYDTSQSSDLSGLKNVYQVSDWSEDGVRWAVGAGLLSGIERNGVKDLAPQGNATRAQVAAILQRFCEAYNL